MLHSRLHIYDPHNLCTLILSPIFSSMSSRQPPSPPSESQRRDDERPTLPPIRQLFGRELEQGVPPRAPSRGAFAGGRHPAQDDPRLRAPGSPAPGQWRGASTSQQYPPAQGHPSQYPPGAAHPGAHGAPSQYPVHARTPAFGQQSSGTYPYPGSYAPNPNTIPIPGPATMPPGGGAPGERPSRYECSYCGRGFTRPSSLRIHINTHTGERPYTCPFPGCGRSFSVQSNMRRHSRVHTRTDAAPGEGEGEVEEGGTEESSDGHEAEE